MLAVTDIHLSNQNSDIEQFCTRFIPDIRAVAESFGDTPVYSLNMGDSRGTATGTPTAIRSKTSAAP